jgi:pimeloyl-ACP methyl ester carboxylesterase
VLGFSQGAVLAHLICAIAAGRGKAVIQVPATAPAGNGGAPAPLPEGAATSVASEAAFATLRFAIMVSGFPSRSRAHGALMHVPAGTGDPNGLPALSIPSLHVWGEGDELVPAAGSALLAQQFDEATRQALVHDGGHIVPGTADARAKIAEFVAQFETDQGGTAAPPSAGAEHAHGNSPVKRTHAL